MTETVAKSVPPSKIEAGVIGSAQVEATEYKPKVARRKLIATAGGIPAAVAAATVVVLVLAGLIPIHPGPATSKFVIGGVTYRNESVSLSLPNCSNSTNATSAPDSVQFQSVTFVVSVVYWCSPGGGVLRGSGMESNGTTYKFSISGAPASTTWATWVSPDQAFGIEWNRGADVQLLVRG